MATTKTSGKRNLTVRLDRQTIQKAKVIAASRSTTISDILAQQIELLVAEEWAYERARRQATALLDQGFHLGGAIRARRDDHREL
jgi:hypothetical protein